jgi:hypothetical protein
VSVADFLATYKFSITNLFWNQTVPLAITVYYWSILWHSLI